MTENSSGEDNIETLAQRAKEVLDRVRANVDEQATQIDTSLPASTFLTPGDDLSQFDVDEVADTHEVPDTERLDEVWAVDEVRDVDEVEDVDSDEESADAEGERPVQGEPAPAAGIVPTEPDEQAEVETSAEASDDVREVTTNLVSTDVVEGEDAPVEDEDDPRALGWLVPVVLLAVVVLALIIFGGDLFNSSDDEDTSNGSGQTAVSTTTAAPETTESPTTEADTTSTESTSSTSTTSTTEGPPAPVATAWDLLGEASGTDEFASFAGPLGLQGLLESAPADDGSGGFTLLAPSNEAMAALSQEQLAALSLDPAAAQALVDYHVVDGRLTQELLLDAAGGQINSSVGLPITVALDGDRVLLNGSVSLSATTLESLNGNVIVIDAVLEPPTINSVINLGDVQFEVISAIITPEGQAELQKAVAFFTDNPGANAVIQGHTDTDGPSEPNQRLSERRAQAVREYLISQGIDGARLEAEGFGESLPILVDGVEDKAASRRIEFVLR